jgi:hypothetical protein
MGYDNGAHGDESMQVGTQEWRDFLSACTMNKASSVITKMRPSNE